MRVNKHTEPPVVRLGQLVAQGFEVAVNLCNMSANRRFRMAGTRLTRIQVALVARVTGSGIENLLVVTGPLQKTIPA